MTAWHRNLALFAACAGALPWCAFAQTHAVRNPDSVVRAVGVFEWTGPEAKPTASRLVPITVFIDGQLQDAGVYLARPVPFALGTGTIFEVRKAGIDMGTLELAYQRHYVASGTGSFDDGWMAVGAFKPRPEDNLTALKQRGPLPRVEVSGGSGPHFSNSSATTDGRASPSTRSTVDRSGAAGSGTTVSAQDDPGRPTLHRAGDSSSPSSGSGSTGSTPTASNTDTTDSSSDVDRPTLRRRTPDQVHAAAKAKDQAAVLGGGTSLNDDPDRPSLHRGKPVTRMEEADLPPLHGIPADMHQEVAVSDAKNRPEHDFARPWESDAEHASVLAQIQDAARAQLKAYGDAPVAKPPVASTQPTLVKPTPQTPAARRRAAAAAKAAAAQSAGAPPITLADEALHGYTLSYGGAATYVYTASAAGSGGVPRYVTLVAQRDPLGTLKVAFSSVTDGAHLDRTPWYRPVDAVDAEASNRASLLFELRGQTTRAFALYRVIGAQAQQTFVTSPAE